MPTRLIKESVCTSEDINKMSWYEECFYHRLWTHCDDFGRMDARPAILKSKLFPLKDRLSLKDIENALLKLVDIGCVKLYICDSKPYLYLPKWEAHQNVRAKKSKFPAPNSINTSEYICEQMNTDASKCPRNPIQSESNPYPLLSGENSPDRTAKIELTLNDKTEYPIFDDDVAKWSELYPAVDVMQSLRNMKGWLDSNPQKRKTKGGILRFINAWLSKEQDKPKAQISSNSIFDERGELN